jgi:phosphopantetheinyl transferase (holo-ACP synthase)
MSGYSGWAIIDKASTGNDLVSLAATQPERTKLPRFYSRILTPAETEGYHRHRSTPSGLPFDHYIWLCWSIKESVYKYQKRLYPELAFAPLRISIRQLDPPDGPHGYYQGTVVGPALAPSSATATNVGDTAPPESETLYSRTRIQDGVIMTVVSEDPEFSDTRWGYSTIGSTAYAEQSAAVRTLLLGELKTALSRQDLRLQKDPAGCPIVLAGDQPLAIPVSLAHHDRYVGYSYRLPDDAAE